MCMGCDFVSPSYFITQYGIFLSNPPSTIYFLCGSQTPFKIVLHLFFKIVVGSETIFLPSKNKLLLKLSLCLPDCFNFLLALGHDLSFSHEFSMNHHECIPAWKNQMHMATLLQIKKYRDTCKFHYVHMFQHEF
jgi:hypothetical protein